MIPTKENGAPDQEGAALMKRYEDRNVAEKRSSRQLTFGLINVDCLRKSGIKFQQRPAACDIILVCPECDGGMILHECEPWHFCLGRNGQVDRLSFEEAFAELRRTRP